MNKIVVSCAVGCVACLAALPVVAAPAPNVSANLTVKAAIKQAVAATRGHNVFTIYDVQKDGTPLTDRFRDVEIQGERQPDGSVRVMFNLPACRTTKGKLPAGNLLEVKVSPTAAQCRVFPFKPGPVSVADEKRVCAAIVVVLEQHLTETPQIELAVGTMKNGKGYDVFVSSIPYVPGGHAVYILSEKNTIKEVVPGA